MATRQRSSEGRQLKASESMEEVETPTSALGAPDSIAIRRARNRLAARKSRQKRAEKNEELVEQVSRLEEQVNYWRSVALQQGQGNDVVDGQALGAANARTESPEGDLEEEEERLRKELEHLHRKNRVLDLRRQVAEARRLSESAGEDLGAVHDRTGIDRGDQQSTSLHNSEDNDRALDSAAKRRRFEDPTWTSIDPKPYHGQTSTEYIAFTRACEQIFDGRSADFRHDEDKIAYAMEFIPKDLQASWHRQTVRHDNTWSRFKNFLLDDLEGSSSNLSRIYFLARQGKDQTVVDFVAYLCGLEEQMGLPFNDKLQRDHLFNSLRPTISDAMRDSPEQPQTRSDLVRLAIDIEKTQKRQIQQTAPGYTNGRSGNKSHRSASKAGSSAIGDIESRDQR